MRSRTRQARGLANNPRYGDGAEGRSIGWQRQIVACPTRSVARSPSDVEPSPAMVTLLALPARGSSGYWQSNSLSASARGFLDAMRNGVLAAPDRR